MDPNWNLREQLEICKDINDACYEVRSQDDLRFVELAHDASRLVELVETLNTWLSKGGALPDAWRR